MVKMVRRYVMCFLPQWGKNAVIYLFFKGGKKVFDPLCSPLTSLYITSQQNLSAGIVCGMDSMFIHILPHLKSV